MNKLMTVPSLAKIALLALAVVFVWNRPQSSSDWAAWIQAIGTICAVLAGFVYHSWQINFSLRRILEKSIKALEAAHREIDAVSKLDMSAGLDTIRLKVLISILESSYTKFSGSLEDELSIRLVILKLNQYVNAWDGSGNHNDTTRTVEDIFNALDAQGDFRETVSVAKEALESSLGRLQKNPLLSS